MSQNTFDKAQSQYERKMARQRQLDMMEAAASGQSQTFSLSDTADTSPTPLRTTLAPEGAIESARRFLWDEDEDDYQSPPGRRQSFVGTGTSPPDVNQNINLMNNSSSDDDGFAMPPPSSSRIGELGSRIRNSLPRFSARTGTEADHHEPVNLAPRRHSVWHGDASPATEEAEEYLQDMEFNRSRRGGVCSSIGDCFLAVFHTIVGCFALLFEYIVGCFSMCGRNCNKRFLLVVAALGVLAMGIVSIVALAKGSDGGSTSPAVSPRPEVVDLERFTAISQVILESAFTSSDELITPGTAQNLAARWLTDDDPAKLPTDDDALLQRYALATFFFSTYVRSEFDDKNNNDTSARDEWNNMDWWMTEKGICMWYGVACPPHLHEGKEEVQYNENSDVIHFNLTANNVRGTIPSELIALENLVTLDLGKNDLKGTVPVSLTNFRDLAALYLEENDMTGTLPTELGKLTMLKDLYVGTNRMTGTIPTELNKLTLLRGLGLDECYFTGSIPYLWDLKGLLILYLDDNELTGTLSDDIRYMTEMVDFRLRKNMLNGTLPIEFHWMQKLQLLYLDDNEFSGTVPEVFDRTPRLEELHLYKNNFRGVIPDSIEALNSLKILYLDNNYFEGTIPRNLGNLRDLHTMYLFNNKLEGEIPSHLGNMEDLEDLQLQNNQLQGTIPTELAECYKLAKVELQDNALTGNIPTEFGDLDSLSILKVFRNNLAGAVPSEVCQMTNDGNLDFIAADCSIENGGTHTCDCCDACYP